MKEKEYNKYGEYVGKTVITRSQIEKSVRSKGVSELFGLLLITLCISPLMLVLVPYVLDSFRVFMAHKEQMVKFQLIGQYAYHFLCIVVLVGLPILLAAWTIMSIFKMIKLKKGEFFVEVDEVNYLDVVVRRNRRHTEERLVIYFYKYGRYETHYRFDSDFAKHNEKFYLVLSKEEKPQILGFYRFSKYEYQE